jgi:hypothetical protein
MANLRRNVFAESARGVATAALFFNIAFAGPISRLEHTSRRSDPCAVTFGRCLGQEARSTAIGVCLRWRGAAWSCADRNKPTGSTHGERHFAPSGRDLARSAHWRGEKLVSSVPEGSLPSQGALDAAWPRRPKNSSASLTLPLWRSDRAARGDPPGFSNLH